MFYDKMTAALNTSVEDKDVFGTAVADAIKASEVLYKETAFSSARDMQFAQLVAANQFDSLLETTNTELDYLRMIEENTRAQVDVMVQQMNDISKNFDSALLTQINATRPSDKQISPLITEAYQAILGYNPEAEGAAYWQNDLDTGSVSAENITLAIGTAAISDLYQTLLGRAPDAAGLAYWTNELASGNLDPKLIDDAIRSGDEYKALHGFASGGYTGDVPTSSVAGIVHGQEYVVNAKTTRDLGLNNSVGVFNDMLSELKELRRENSDMKLYLSKITSDTSRSLSTQRATLDVLSA
jgi:hypothetical protein